MGTRLRLTRADGRIYLDRWGIERKWLGGIFLHKMEGPDPGIDLHDHPWSFISMPVVGGYIEERLETRRAVDWARNAEAIDQRDAATFLEVTGSPGRAQRGVPDVRHRFRWRRMRLDECHRITELTAPVVWTLVVHGPSRRRWGFYLPDGWMSQPDYDNSVRAERRDMGVEFTNVEEERFHFDGTPAGSRHWLDRLLFRDAEAS